MKITTDVKDRISNERHRLLQYPGVNNNGDGVPVKIAVHISIDEILQMSNDPMIDMEQKSYLKKKIKAYYTGVEMFGENRTIPVIDQYGKITIWID